jgi:hypothetical protein
MENRWKGYKITLTLTLSQGGEGTYLQIYPLSLWERAGVRE